MEAHTFLIQLVLILFAAKVFGEIASYLQIPTVIGELIAGIFIGPSVLNLIELSAPINLLAQMGIILLLFEVGIETDIGRLAASGVKALLVAVGGVALPFALGLLASYYIFGFSLLASLFIGSTLTATSIGITLRVLRELTKQNTREAQIIIGAAVLDDIIGIILLSMLYELSSNGTVNLFSAGKVLILITFFFLLSPIAAKWLSQLVKKWEEFSHIPGFLPSTIVSLVLLFAWIAHQFGAPEILGGFAAGLALSHRFFFPLVPFLQETPEFNQKVEEQIKPIVHLFTPIFFVATGLSLNLKTIDWGSTSIWLLTGSLLLIAIVGKILSGFLLVKEKSRIQWIIGVAMIPRGEVGLIFANVGLTAGVIQNEVYASILMVITLTTLLAPLALRYLYGRLDQLPQAALAISKSE